MRPPHLLLLIILATACGEDPIGPRTVTGALEVSVSTSGGPADPDGYALSVDQGAPSPVGANGSMTLDGLATGLHSLAISGLAANCALEGPNPRSITIASGATLQVALRVDCGEAGPLELVTETSGGGPDVDGYAVTVDAGPAQAIAASGTLTVTGLGVGQHRIRLDGLAANCRVAGENPRVARLEVDQRTRVTFAVTCPGPGAVAVTANTTGQQLDLDGYTVALDGGSEIALPFGGSVTLEAVAPGQHAVALGGIASNCAISGANPVTVEVQGDATAAVTFRVSCSGEPGLGAGELLFTSDRGGATHLYRIRRDGSGLVDLTPAVSVSGGRWSPDGSRILFSSVRDGKAELFVMDADGANLRRLTRTPEGEVHAVWSPDGSRIATSADGDIRLLNADGSGSVVLGPGTRPSWSPDGTRIAFDRINPSLRNPFTGEHASDIYVAAVDGSGLTALTHTNSAFLSYAAPAWSPDGSRIACWRQSPGPVILTVTTSIVAIPARGGLLVPLVASDVVRSTPVWSPDGQSIAFAHDRAGPGTALRVVTLADGRTSDLTPGNAVDIPTSWR